MSAFYKFNLAGFVALNTYLLVRQYKFAGRTEKEHGVNNDEEQAILLPPSLASSDQQSAAAVKKFVRDYFPVYACAVAADWIQGPHIYAIYKYDKALSEKMVAALYATGFVSGALSASFAGQLADRYGRRRACAVYCLMYLLTCLTMLSDNIFVLFLGRITGGVATTLLFSVFDAWMISEYHSRGLANSTLSLANTFSYAATMSSLMAITMGVLGDILVTTMGSRVWPFIGGIGFCITAAAWMAIRWSENYGDIKDETHDQESNIKRAIKAIISNPRSVALMVTTTFFESSMYLFVFFWSAALKSARSRVYPAGTDIPDLPFGLIFACFMCAMMTGSSIFNLLRPDTKIATGVLLTVILMACIGLCSASVLKIEALLFYAFVVIEGAIGAYFPSMNLLKSEVIDDSIRGSIYSLMRLPLNLFVVITHSLDEEGDGHRNNVFLTLAVLLLVSFEVVRRSF